MCVSLTTVKSYFLVFLKKNFLERFSFRTRCLCDVIRPRTSEKTARSNVEHALPQRERRCTGGFSQVKFLRPSLPRVAPAGGSPLRAEASVEQDVTAEPGRPQRRDMTRPRLNTALFVSLPRAPCLGLGGEICCHTCLSQPPKKFAAANFVP